MTHKAAKVDKTQFFSTIAGGNPQEKQHLQKRRRRLSLSAILLHARLQLLEKLSKLEMVGFLSALHARTFASQVRALPAQEQANKQANKLADKANTDCIQALSDVDLPPASHDLVRGCIIFVIAINVAMHSVAS